MLRPRHAGNRAYKKIQPSAKRDAQEGEIVNKSPAFQFYPDKWQTDTRRLSWEAKGIYHELICIVWLQFQETCCFPDDDDFISSEIGCSIEAWQRTKTELLNPHRPIIEKLETNRLLVGGLLKEFVKQRDRRYRLRENGMLGGRPKNQKVILEEPKHKAGSENLNERLPSPSPSPSPIKRERENAALALAVEVFNEWNKTEVLPKILIMSTGRKQKLMLRLGDKFFAENWRSAMIRLQGSNFARGLTERGWKATLDWFCAPDSVAKIMEGKYDNSKFVAPRPGDRPKPTDDFIGKSLVESRKMEKALNEKYPHQM